MVSLSNQLSEEIPLELGNLAKPDTAEALR